MTEEQKDRVLADCLEAYHRERARGEVPDLVQYRERLGDLYEEFVELLEAETAIDEALDSYSEDSLPQTWGEYILLSEIGRGGAGIVYEAVHRKLGRKVALKVLQLGVDTDRTARERFRREAQALAQVRHDNIVEIYEYGELGNRLYYAMALVEGPSLAALRKRDRRPSPQETCTGLAGVADALQALHEQGIIHRDVKSSNIMIAPNGRYMLADFGLARTELAETMTRTGDALGTPLYMSPEQIMGKRDAVEARSDIYGLGATLYEMLCGQRPFEPDTLPALMQMILKERAPGPNTVNPDLPPGCSSIAMKCLEKEPRYRYDSAEELAGELRAFAEGRRVSTRPVTSVQRGTRYVRNNPLRTLVASAAVAIVAVGAFYAFWPDPAPRLSVEVAHRAATVEVNGAAPRPAPLHNHPVEKGAKNHLIVRPEDTRLRPYETWVILDRDKSIEIPFFEPFNGRDPATLDLIREDMGAGPAPREKTDTRRGYPKDQIIEVAFPRGNVRRADLTEWRVFQGLDFEAKYAKRPGQIEFHIDGQRVYGTPFPPSEYALNRVSMPQEVLDAIQPGSTVTWGFFPPDEKKDSPRTTTFTLVDDALDAEVQSRMDLYDANMAEWKDERTKRLVRATLRAELLLNKGLPLGAYQELMAVAAPAPEPGELEAVYRRLVPEDATQGLIELERIALRRLYPKRSERDDATPWAAYGRHYQAWNSDAWKAFHAESTAAAAK